MTRYAVAASSAWIDPDGVRRPGGEVHGWVPGTNQTLCGLALRRSALAPYPHVDWADAQPESGRHARRRPAGVPALRGGGPAPSQPAGPRCGPDVARPALTAGGVDGSAPG